MTMSTASIPVVAKMASHAIFQYNILAIDDIHNTWTREEDQAITPKG